MGMQINTNIAALNAHRNLSNTQNDLSKSLEKLSSGLRINRAADDAAGLSISEGLRSQVNGMNVAARNAQDGIAVIQTAEGALTEVHSILQRMRDLAVQAGNDSNNAESRTAIKTEIDGLASELNRIGASASISRIRPSPPRCSPAPPLPRRRASSRTRSGNSVSSASTGVLSVFDIATWIALGPSPSGQPPSRSSPCPARSASIDWLPTITRVFPSPNPAKPSPRKGIESATAGSARIWPRRRSVSSSARCWRRSR